MLGERFPGPSQSHFCTNHVLSSMKSGVLAAVLIKISVFWNISCRLACRYQYLERVQWVNLFSSIRRIPYTQALFVYMCTWTMQQDQIPVHSAVNVPMISAACRKAHAGWQFFQLFTEVLHVPCTKLFNTLKPKPKQGSVSSNLLCSPLPSTDPAYIFVYVL